MALSPRESGKLIAKLADHVKVNPDGVEKLGKKILEELEANKLSFGSFSQNDYHPKPEDPWAVDWLFLIDTLNFCFWKYENTIGWTVEGKTGYFALCAAINRALKEGIDITNPHFYSKITEEQLANILRSDNEHPVPLFKKRIECLHEVGTILIEKFNETFKTCLEECQNSAVKLLKIIVDNFACFRDEATYKGHKIAIYKRAQILIGDIWSCFQNKHLGQFSDINEITMMADYRIPQSIIYFGAMEYSDELNKILKANTLLENGSEMEVEIRGVSIYVVDLVKEWVDEKSGKKFDINATHIDHFLWDFRRAHAEEILRLGIPFHKTLSVYY